MQMVVSDCAFRHIAASDSAHHYLWGTGLWDRVRAEVRYVPCLATIGRLGLQRTPPPKAARQSTQHFGRLEGYADFCALAVAGEVYHESPPATDAAQLRSPCYHLTYGFVMGRHTCCRAGEDARR